MAKHFLSVRVTEHWHQMSRKVMESSSFEILKNHLGMFLYNQPRLNRTFGLDVF